MVKPQPECPECRGGGLVVSVEPVFVIPYDGIVFMGKLDADLVRPPRLQADLNQAHILVLRQCHETQFCLPGLPAFLRQRLHLVHDTIFSLLVLPVVSGGGNPVNYG